MSDFEVKADLHGVDEKLEEHAAEVAPKLQFLLNNVVQSGRNEIIRISPRGKRCQAIKGSGRGGFKAAIMGTSDSGSGHIYVDKGIAPYADWVIDGRGPVHAKTTSYLGKDTGYRHALRFCIDGKVIYRRSVGPAKGNPVFDKAKGFILMKARSETDRFTRWVTNL